MTKLSPIYFFVIVTIGVAAFLGYENRVTPAGVKPTSIRCDYLDT